MKEILEKIITNWICSIIYRTDLSIDKQTKILYKKLSKYNYSFIDNYRQGTEISESFIKTMIIDLMQRKQWEPIMDYYITIISNIADKIIERKAKELF